MERFFKYFFDIWNSTILLLILQSQLIVHILVTPICRSYLMLSEAPFFDGSGLVTFKIQFFSQFFKMGLQDCKSPSLQLISNLFHPYLMQSTFRQIYKYTDISVNFLNISQEDIWSCTPPGTVHNMTHACLCCWVRRGGFWSRLAMSNFSLEGLVSTWDNNEHTP